MDKPIITLSDVGIRYRKRRSFFRHSYYHVLDAVSFDIIRGETLGVIGRNGCGKSTLLRLISGVFQPDTGHIERNKATISLLALSVGFIPELSGKDNIVISAMLLGASKQTAYNNVNTIAEFSELDHFIEEPVKTYSSGMRMRLGFSIAITIQPDVLLIDEVLGAGDAHFRKKAETAILDKVSSHQTIVLVSHNSAQVKKLCDRAIWLENGTVELQGDAECVVSAYEKFLVTSRGVGGGRDYVLG